MGSHRSVEVVQKELEAGFAELAHLLTADLSEGEITDAVLRAERLRSMAEAHSARAAGLLEASKAWVPDGARSAKAWMTWRARVSGERAGLSLATGRRLRDMPLVDVAFANGDVSEDHVRLLAVARRTSPEAFTADGEDRLLGLARELAFADFEKAVRYWCQLVAPDDVEEQARRRYEGRRVHCSRTIHDTVVIDGVLDPVGGAIVARMCELSDGTVVTPGEVLPVLVDADVERVVFDGPSKVIDIGVRRRFFTGATRTAVQLRDRTCTHPSCHLPAEACEIDHIVEYASGGLTTQANGRCRCSYHHRRARDG